MQVNEAVKIAKQYILELFADEKISNLGLEEVEFDPEKQEWMVTVGFSRPWDEPHNVFAAMTNDVFTRRTFKALRISDVDGQILSVKRREVGK